MSLDLPSVTAWFGRQANANLPVDPGRKGSCNGCGKCCRLVFRCPYLKDDNSCGNYENRPATCRAYPRTKAEQVISYPTCGYHFNKEVRYMSDGPAFGGYMMPVDRRDIARDVRENMEGLWSWTPAAEGISEDLKKIEHFGAADYNLTVRGDGYEVPMDTWLAQNAGNLHMYGQQTWSPMISTSYPGMFWNPSTGKMETQAQIMSKLNWPTMGGIPYQYNPQRRRGFMGIEYPLAGYGADNNGTVLFWGTILAPFVAIGLGFALLKYLEWSDKRIEEKFGDGRSE